MTNKPSKSENYIKFSVNIIFGESMKSLPNKFKILCPGGYTILKLKKLAFSSVYIFLFLFFIEIFEFLK